MWRFRFWSHLLAEGIVIELSSWPPPASVTDSWSAKSLKSWWRVMPKTISALMCVSAYSLIWSRCSCSSMRTTSVLLSLASSPSWCSQLRPADNRAHTTQNWPKNVTQNWHKNTRELINRWPEINKPKSEIKTWRAAHFKPHWTPTESPKERQLQVKIQWHTDKEQRMHSLKRKRLEKIMTG